MRQLIILAALLAFVPATQAQQLKPSRISIAPVFDADDEGVLPLTMSTPLGEATVLVYKGWASVSIVGVQIAFAPIAKIPLLPGMQDATVGTTGCWMHLSPQGILSGPESFTTTGTGSTLGSAVAAYHEAVETMESLGWVQVAGSCEGGSTGT
jgi:hypothetical protein